MTPERLQQFKRWVKRLWVMSPERLWLASIALRTRGHWVLAFWIKQLNSFLYHNSLAPGASVSPDVFLGHNSLGIVINRHVEIGRRVTIWQNVTLAAGLPEKSARENVKAGAHPQASGARARIIIEDDVKIGANAVVIAPRATTLRIGRAARIGAGTVVTQDVPAGATVVGPRPRVLPRATPPGEGQARPSEQERLD